MLLLDVVVVLVLLFSGMEEDALTLSSSIGDGFLSSSFDRLLKDSMGAGSSIIGVSSSNVCGAPELLNLGIAHVVAGSGIGLWILLKWGFLGDWNLEKPRGGMDSNGLCRKGKIDGV